MILFYRMPYILLGDDDSYAENQDPQDLIDSADCLRLDIWPRDNVHRNNPNHPPYPECYYRDAFPDGRCSPKKGINFFVDYSDIKMCHVATRKEAFAEINRFLDVNNLHTNRTSIATTGNESLITLFYEPPPSVPFTDCRYIYVAFVLMDTDDNEAVPTDSNATGLKSYYLTPSKPNKYLQQYLDHKGES